MNKDLREILVVDDDVVNGFIAAKLLDEIFPEKTIRNFLNGFDALDFICASTDNYPRLVFLDINMPGMNGIEFLDHLSKDTNSKLTKVILCSGSDIDECNNSIFKNDLVLTSIKKPLNTNSLNKVLTINHLK